MVAVVGSVMGFGVENEESVRGSVTAREELLCLNTKHSTGAAVQVFAAQPRVRGMRMGFPYGWES